MRCHFLSLDQGEVVAVIKTKLVHKAIGPTYWILSFNGFIYQVEGSVFGRNLNQLLAIERPVKEESQIVCNDLAHKLLATGQYARERKNEIAELLARSRKGEGQGHARNGS